MPLAFDPLYLLLMLPGMAVAGWAQNRIASAYREGSRYRVSSGVTGAKAAAIIMRSSGIDNVPIEPVAGQLTDHYDPLKLTGLITPAEDQVVGKVLGAAAMTYVAGTLTSILQLLFFVIRARGFGRRRDDTRV